MSPQPQPSKPTKEQLFQKGISVTVFNVEAVILATAVALGVTDAESVGKLGREFKDGVIAHLKGPILVSRDAGGLPDPRTRL